MTWPRIALIVTFGWPLAAFAFGVFVGAAIRTGSGPAEQATDPAPAPRSPNHPAGRRLQAVPPAAPDDSTLYLVASQRNPDGSFDWTQPTLVHGPALAGRPDAGGQR